MENQESSKVGVAALEEQYEQLKRLERKTSQDFALSNKREDTERANNLRDRIREMRDKFGPNTKYLDKIDEKLDTEWAGVDERGGEG